METIPPPSAIWLSGSLVTTVCIGAIVLSIQWGIHRKRQQGRIYLSEHDEDQVMLPHGAYKRDLSVPFDDSYRITRITYFTLLLTTLAALDLYAHVSSVNHHDGKAPLYAVGSSICVFVCSLYATMLAMISRRHQLPNAWGWILNVHLCTIYTIAWLFSVVQFYLVVVCGESNLSWFDVLPYLVSVLLCFDLMYVTATTKQGPPFLDEMNRPVCNLNVESIFGQFCFIWPYQQIVHNVTEAKKSGGEEVSDKDLPRLTPSYISRNIYHLFGATRGKGSSLFYRLCKANSPALGAQALFAVLSAFEFYVPAIFYNRLLQLFQDVSDGVHYDRPMEYGSLLVFGIGFSLFLKGALFGQLWYYANSAVQCRLKTMLNLEIYRKSLRRRDLAAAATTASDEKKEGTSDDDKNKEAFTIGAVVNLMGTDTTRISDFAAVWFALISAPIQLFVGVYFLYQLMGVSCLYGLLAMIFIVPINHFNTKIFAKTQDKLMEARDKRVSLMTEVLQGIRQIKFFAWESKWEERVMKSRNEELRQLAITYINGVFFSVVWQGAPILVTLVSFYSFTKIEGKQLNTPIAFTAINVFNDLRYALNIIPTSIIELIQARASLKRIERFLNEDEIEAPLALSNKTSVDIGFEKATIGWKKEDKHTTAASSADNEEKASFILKDLSVKFPNHQLSLISGATGSGKTLMLLGLLGEAILIDGQVDCPRVPVSDTIDFDFDSSTTQEISSDDWIVDRSLAYVSQTVWLQNASIRDNILFGLPYLEPRYKETLTACALDKDLSIFEDGDLTEIGEKGITLSGGQKARVTLARAVYSRAGNVLMDDVLSAVDAHTAKHLYEQCLMGPLMKGRTRILVTHHIKLCIKGCSLLVHIGNGRVASVGSPAELREAGILAKIIEEDVEELVDEDDIIDDAGIPRIESSTTLATKDDQKKAPPSARVLVGEESRASGSVKLRLYKSYFGLFGKAGYWIGLASIILASRCLEVGEEWWLKIWAQSYSTYSGGNMTMVDSPSSTFFATIESMFPTATTNDESAPDGITHLNYYLGIFTLITCVNACSGSLRYAYVYWGVLGANRKLYSELLHRVFRAPLRFFDTTPMGRILNRFSKDFESVDSNIPTSMLSFAIQWFVIVTIAMIVCIAIPAFLIPIIIMSIICIYVGINYVTCARELKRLESITRSPIFSNFTETVAGVTTIRAFGASQQFLKVMMESIDANIRPVYCSAAASRWVGLRYSMTSGGIGFVACAITLYYMGHIDVALVGFTLTIVLSFNDNMFAGILMYTGLEMNFNAVERIVEFTEIDQEADAITGMRPPPQWPTHGKIEVKDLQVRYAADLNPVLKGVSFSIKPQEKIGIVGRTGSGKSTLALSFFRFVEASQGSITIDNLNIKDIGTEDLRSNLTIIPQDPTLFSGSLRSNMDPFDEFQDQDIFAALCRVHLIPSSNNPSISGEDQQQDQETVNDNVFKDLDANVSEGGKNFSQGQRQLLCLARALLKSSRVVLMDEATASVDFETDKAIQKTITTEFSDSTILCIAHRLHTVIEYDRILLLDQGKVAEFDSPLTLLRRPDSAFYKMCKKSGEFDQLMELATARSQL